MVAMLELPGVKHGELSVTLATEPYTHARQITIAGRTRPPFEEPTPEERERTKRERKFGDFLRRLQVPPHTQVRSQFFIVALPNGTGCVSLPDHRHRGGYERWHTCPHSSPWHAGRCGSPANHHDPLDHCTLSVLLLAFFTNTCSEGRLACTMLCCFYSPQFLSSPLLLFVNQCCPSKAVVPDSPI